MKFVLIGVLALCTASCGIYKSKFDCPPGKGIGCASVGEVLDLIVERDDGEDLFLYDRGAVLVLKQQEQEKKVAAQKKKGKLRLIKQNTGELSLEEGVEKR